MQLCLRAGDAACVCKPETVYTRNKTTRTANFRGGRHVNEFAAYNRSVYGKSYCGPDVLNGSGRGGDVFLFSANTVRDPYTSFLILRRYTYGQKEGAHPVSR